MPSIDVIGLLESIAVATNRPLPNVTDLQPFASGALRAVQVTPSGEVITRFVPLKDTATNNPLPYVTDHQLFVTAA
ncbi:unannotated protein [freshwater metagenome]|uniref:Unannotated protein n=1 Tax=freshwater metagenome TaxID=449393 RepID=A0A6J7KXJ0_9ZZZZ